LRTWPSRKFKLLIWNLDRSPTAGSAGSARSLMLYAVAVGRRVVHAEGQRVDGG
jgi:hypothetical protein